MEVIWTQGPSESRCLHVHKAGVNLYSSCFSGFHSFFFSFFFTSSLSQTITFFSYNFFTNKTTYYFFEIWGLCKIKNQILKLYFDVYYILFIISDIIKP